MAAVVRRSRSPAVEEARRVDVAAEALKDGGLGAAILDLRDRRSGPIRAHDLAGAQCHGVAGVVEKKDVLKVLWHETQVGVLLGLLVGVAGFIRAWTFGGDPLLGATIGLAVSVIVFWSRSVGSLLPLFAFLFGVDPALISGPLMSTLVDASGLFIYLSVAQWILGV